MLALACATAVEEEPSRLGGDDEAGSGGAGATAGSLANISGSSTMAGTSSSGSGSTMAMGGKGGTSPGAFGGSAGSTSKAGSGGASAGSNDGGTTSTAGTSSAGTSAGGKGGATGGGGTSAGTSSGSGGGGTTGTSGGGGTGSGSCSPTVASIGQARCNSTAVHGGKLYKCLSQAMGVNGEPASCGTTGVYCSQIVPTDAAWGTTAWQFVQNCN
jgi:hypothetical protein